MGSDMRELLTRGCFKLSESVKQLVASGSGGRHEHSDGSPVEQSVNHNRVAGAWLAVVVLFFASACKKPASKASSSNVDSQNQTPSVIFPRERDPARKTESPKKTEKIEKIEGVSIFFRSTPSQQEEELPEGAEVGELQGRLAGALKIVHGCLEVKGSAILWERREKSKLEIIVKHLLANEPVDVDLGGGSLNAFMNDKTLRQEFPDMFSECPNTKSVWVSHSLEWTLHKRR